MFTFPFQLLSSSPNRVPSSRLHQIKRVNFTSQPRPTIVSIVHFDFIFILKIQLLNLSQAATLGGHRQLKILLSVQVKCICGRHDDLRMFCRPVILPKKAGKSLKIFFEVENHVAVDTVFSTCLSLQEEGMDMMNRETAHERLVFHKNRAQVLYVSF